MTVGRWVIGLPSLAGAAALSFANVGAEPEAQLPLAFAAAALAIVGLGLLAPLLVPRLAALLALPAPRRERPAHAPARTRRRPAHRVDRGPRARRGRPCGRARDDGELAQRLRRRLRPGPGTARTRWSITADGDLSAGGRRRAGRRARRAVGVTARGGSAGQAAGSRGPRRRGGSRGARADAAGPDASPASSDPDRRHGRARRDSPRDARSQARRGRSGSGCPRHAPMARTRLEGRSRCVADGFASVGIYVGRDVQLAGHVGDRDCARGYTRADVRAVARERRARASTARAVTRPSPT